MHAVAGGLLRLCANPSALGGGFLPALLAAYAARHPDVRIDLVDMLSEDAVRLVAAGTAELAVIGDNTPGTAWRPSFAMWTKWC
jgi:DNA-binding transcriptional LysR family regulator